MITPENAIKEIRQGIDQIDSDILLLIRARIFRSEEIGAIKRHHGMAIQNSSRESTILDRIRNEAKALDIPRKPMKRIFTEIMCICRKAQEVE